ncbi:hypothetical protein ES319_D02G272900v1 [Gossypium barbadense]|uniref:Uncharacterized protein n=1 Tax=Gossypium barbadense TaxID=3634 RepID=A0A5J5SN34_GOSBA|nr:hypothetical protein ES319_D02G272900v1 [Gossypium barbadense]
MTSFVMQNLPGCVLSMSKAMLLLHQRTTARSASRSLRKWHWSHC